MKVWITAGALIKGVFVTEDYEIRPDHPGEIFYAGEGWFKAGDWHTSEDAALARVTEMVERRLAKIEEWKRQMLSLRATLASGELPMVPEHGV